MQRDQARQCGAAQRARYGATRGSYHYVLSDSGASCCRTAQRGSMGGTSAHVHSPVLRFPTLGTQSFTAGRTKWACRQSQPGVFADKRCKIDPAVLVDANRAFGSQGGSWKANCASNSTVTGSKKGVRQRVHSVSNFPSLTRPGPRHLRLRESTAALPDIAELPVTQGNSVDKAQPFDPFQP